MSDLAKKLIFSVTAIILTLGALEIGLRVLDFGTITPEMNFGANTRMSLDRGQFLSDHDLFWKLPRNPRDGQMRAIQPDVPVPPKTARRRILVLGDSCSRISYRLPPYPSLLEDSLQSRDVEVWNASVPGYTAWQGRAWLKKQLLTMNSDVAIIYFGWNDHWRSTGITDRDYAARQKGSKLRLLSLLQKPEKPSPLRLSTDDYREAVEAMVHLLQDKGTKVVLVTGPSNLTLEARSHLLRTGYMLPKDNPQALHKEFLSVLRRIAAETDATLLDAAGVFDNLKARPRLMMRDGIHLTDAGHQLLASLLAKALDPALAEHPAQNTWPGKPELIAHAKKVLPSVLKESDARSPR